MSYRHSLLDFTRKATLKKHIEWALIGGLTTFGWLALYLGGVIGLMLLVGYLCTHYSPWLVLALTVIGLFGVVGWHHQRWKEHDALYYKVDKE